MVIYAYSVPAILAFAAKVFLLVYSARSPTRNIRTRLFVVAVLISIALNVVEVAAFQGYFGSAIAYAGYAYYIALGALLAVLFQLSVWVAFEHPPIALRKWLVLSIYGYLLALVVLLASSQLLIAGFQWLGGYTLTRVPGPLYPIFELFAGITLLTILLLPVRGIRQRHNGRLRSRCQIWMLAAAPSCLLVITVLTLLRLDIRWFNATVTLPIPMALLMAAIAYCVHNTRVVDLSWYFPFAKARRVKQSLYTSLTRIVNDAPAGESTKQMLDRLAHALDCPVYLVGPLGFVGTDGRVDRLPTELPLADIRQLAVVDEVGVPLKEIMKKYRIGAIIPLFPTSDVARSWLIFGEAFGARIYTPTDFRTVDRVVKQLAGTLLDNLLHSTTARDQSVVESTPPEPVADVAPSAPPPSSARFLAERLAQYEAVLIADALKACKGNKAKAARLLGLQPNTLHYKLKRLNLPDKKK